MNFNDYWKEKAAKRRKSWVSKAKRFAEQHTQLEDIRKEVYLPLDYGVGFSFEDYKPVHFIKLNPIACWQDMIFCFSEDGLRAALESEGADMNSFKMGVNRQSLKGKELSQPKNRWEAYSYIPNKVFDYDKIYLDWLKRMYEICTDVETVHLNYRQITMTIKRYSTEGMPFGYYELHTCEQLTKSAMEAEGDQGQSQGQGQDQQGAEHSTSLASGRGDGGEASYTALWEEDQFQAHQITDLVQSTTQWGSLPGDMVELIKKAAEGKIDYRGALRTFRSSILSQKRRLTRMRPSRRFGFEQMGSHYDFTTRLLIAIDTSGSVGSEELGRYFRIITTFFKYGIQEIDVLMFDHEVQGEPITFTEAKKNKQEFKVKGRGGTNFQAPIDYVKENPNYDGLIIITDGCAPTPDVPPHLSSKLLWVIDNEPSYKQHYESLRKTGRICLMEL